MDWPDWGLPDLEDVRRWFEYIKMWGWQDWAIAGFIIFIALIFTGHIPGLRKRRE